MDADPWDLVLQGRYSEAVAALSEHLQEWPADTIARANRAAAYLCLRDYAAAALDYQELIRRRPIVDLRYIGLGVCQWCLAQPRAAIEYWKAALSAAYTDAAGGVEPPALLLYAARRLRDVGLEKEALALLRKHARRKGLVNWPSAIVPYLLGRLAPQDLRWAAEHMTGSGILLTRHRCQLDFYRGVRGLCLGDTDAFQEGMRACAASAYGYLEEEFYVATWEVDHHFPEVS